MKGKGWSKYNAKITIYNGKKYRSAFEAKGARDLDIRKKIGEILDYDWQYKLEMMAYNYLGEPVMPKDHKVDFRVHELDGTYTLLEYKGPEEQNFKEAKKWIEALWLPLNHDHAYKVVYNNPRKKPFFISNKVGDNAKKIN